MHIGISTLGKLDSNYDGDTEAEPAIGLERRPINLGNENGMMYHKGSEAIQGVYA